jgi:hypothetical protein
MEDDVGVLNTKSEGQSRTGPPDIEGSSPDEDEEGEPTPTDDRQVHANMDSKPADDEMDPTNTNNGVILDEQVEMQSMNPVRREGQPVVPEDQSATDDQREGSLSKSANDDLAGQTPDVSVQPLNLLGVFTAAAVSSESSESEDSKFVDTRATGLELESGVTTSNSVLEEMSKNDHESDDEDLNSDDSGASQEESGSDDSDSDDHHGQSQSLRKQLLSNHPNIKRMEHLSSRNLDLHDQQRLRRLV